MKELIIFYLFAGALTLILNRSEGLKALTNAVYSRIANLLFSAGEDPAIKVILLTGGTQNITSERHGGSSQVSTVRPEQPCLSLDALGCRSKKTAIAAVCGAAIGISTILLSPLSHSRTAQDRRRPGHRCHFRTGRRSYISERNSSLISLRC